MRGDLADAEVRYPTIIGQAPGMLQDPGMPVACCRPISSCQVDHAVLVVTVGGQSLMLDNLVPRVVSAESNPNYRAYYSINEAGWWMYLPSPLTPQTLSRQVAAR